MNLDLINDSFKNLIYKISAKELVDRCFKTSESLGSLSAQVFLFSVSSSVKLFHRVTHFLAKTLF